MSQLFHRSITVSTICLTIGLGGCAALQSEKPTEEIVESLPESAKKVIDLASNAQPSQRRDWRPELSILPFAEFEDDEVVVRNVRQCRWRSKTDYDVKHDDWRFNWDDVQSVDYIVVPFEDTPMLAHTMLSFGLSDGRHLALSVEARLEAGESYSPLAGTARQYDLMYILGDETDIIGLRAEVRKDNILLYKSIVTPEQSAALLKSVLERANKLVSEPEFYNSLSNSCATNVAEHIQLMKPERNFLDDWRLLFPGHSDRLAYELELIDTSRPFEEVQSDAYVSLKARQHLGSPDFSELIRR